MTKHQYLMTWDDNRLLQHGTGMRNTQLLYTEDKSKQNVNQNNVNHFPLSIATDVMPSKQCIGVLSHSICEDFWGFSVFVVLVKQNKQFENFTFGTCLFVFF